MRLIVISGLSGAGKSVALHTLEDLGFYCVDNLPLSLLAALAIELTASDHPAHQNVAVVIDARNPGAAFDYFDETLDRIAALGVEVEVLYFDADDETLLKRFSETRRRHPLTVDDDTSLSEAVNNERELLGAVRNRATMCIDTTRTHYHQLRELVRNHALQQADLGLSLLFESFGFKNGPPREADLMFDVRCLPNPHWQPELRALTGRDSGVVEFLEASDLAQEMFASLCTFLEPWLPRFEAENRAYLTIALGCTGGRHRSVYLAEKLTRHFRARGNRVLVRHRELAS
ncbi:MAG: RNase adapter RapZ [Gammaproteobacteria bacterium]|nr:RNase adapter RapZ [Gammaproteobacteria bacterium]